jgi:hypothetical protein
MGEGIKWLVPPVLKALRGRKKFKGMPHARVEDFWQFALGDLRMNNARGCLAEYLVGRALGIEPLQRIEWDSYDLLFGEITVEVKSSAYLQLWDQKRLSTLSFSGLQGTRYNPRAPNGGEDPLGRRFNAMVYVFCVQTATEHEFYDQLDATQWEFYVVSRSDLAATGHKSLGIARVKELSKGPTEWEDLKSAVTAASLGQARDDDGDWWNAEVPVSVGNQP